MRRHEWKWARTWTTRWCFTYLPEAARRRESGDNDPRRRDSDDVIAFKVLDLGLFAAALRDGWSDQVLAAAHAGLLAPEEIEGHYARGDGDTITLLAGLLVDPPQSTQ